MGLVLLSLVLVLARLYDVQVREYRVWAAEAASLERSETILPHKRGSIYDRRGKLWVTDEVRYELEFVWRDFRRGHPLGNLAQLRSLLAAKPVSLEEATREPGLWAEALVQLTPAAIRGFSRGLAAEGGRGLRVPAVAKQDRRQAAREERRPARAAAVHFYLQRLLAVTRRESRALREMRDDYPDRPYLELVARIRQAGGQSLPEMLQRTRIELRARIDAAMQRLDFLAEAVDWNEVSGLAHGPVMPASGALLLEVLESARREAEDAAADRLFQTAAGFRPGRLSAPNLRRLDLLWLQRCVYWDAARLDEWIESRGNGWVQQVQQVLSGHVYARFKLNSGRAPEDRVLDALAYFFVDPSERPVPGARVGSFWEGFRSLEVLAEFPTAFAGGENLRAADLRQVLPVEDRGLRRSELFGDDLVAGALWSMQDLRPEPAWDGPGMVQRTAARLVFLAERPGAEWRPGELAPIEDVLLAWDDLLQMRIGSLLGELPQPAAFATGRLRSALEARDHVVKDMDARPRSLARRPSDELVHLVGRYPADYAGFHVRSVTDRVPVATSDWAFVERPGARGVPRLIAKDLIGNVRSPQLLTLLEQRADTIELRRLQRKLELQADDQSRIFEIVEDSLHGGQSVGSTGMEGYLDPELTGRNGYREVVGLQEQSNDGRPALYRPPVDGLPVTLTLDLDLQSAGEWVINHPDEAPADDMSPDDAWVSQPVGAIVLMDVNGEILCAASAPLMAGARVGGADGQAEHVLERAMRKPLFHPPGSIMKPLVAAYALENLGLDPKQGQVICSTLNGRRPGWKAVDCHSTWGHTPSNLALLGIKDRNLTSAMNVSCNTYFAQIGDQLFDEDDFRDLFEIFGLGRPSGVRSLGVDGDGWRGGLREDYAIEEKASYTSVERQRLANGLSNISLTPLAMARAYGGLATGWLPSARLVHSVGGVRHDVPPVRLPISAENLQIVRKAMVGVTTNGSAKGKGLEEADLGFRFTCKTGSADYREGLVPAYGSSYVRGDTQLREGMRKHTWVAGWFPAQDPRYVLVVYLHDTATTSSHSAVYVASQFLREPAVQALMATQEQR